MSSLDPQIALEQDDRLKGLKLTAVDVLRIPHQKRIRPFQRRTLRWLLVVGLLLAVGIGVYVPFPRLTYWKLSSTLGARDSIGRWVAAPTNESKLLAFSDGSHAKLQPNSRLRVVDVGFRGSSLVLETGAVELSVKGNRFCEYRVLAGPFHLTIPKGRVTAVWNPMTLQLDLVVHEGFAVIAGCQFAEGRSVMAGKELGTRCSES